MTSSRFVVAVHVLTLLETERGRPVTSAYIADSVNTNPARLAKPAGHIRLLDVYQAVESPDVFALHRSPPNPKCPVGKHIQPALAAVLGRAERALEGKLGDVSVADVARSVTARARR